MMLHMVAPDLGFGGGWDPESRRLYIVHNKDGKVYEQIAVGVTDAKLAVLMVEMWCKGYRSRARELQRAPGRPHYHMFAESGEFGEMEKVQVEDKSKVT